MAVNAHRPPSFWRHFGPGLALLGFWGIMLTIDAWLLVERDTWIWVLITAMAVLGTFITMLAIKWRLEAWKRRRWAEG